MLDSYFIDRQEVIDMMMLCTIMREPLLLVGEPNRKVRSDRQILRLFMSKRKITLNIC